MNPHREIAFEDKICAHLAEHGWLNAPGDTALDDRPATLFAPDVLAWVEQTRRGAREASQRSHGSPPGETRLGGLHSAGTSQCKVFAL